MNPPIHITVSESLGDWLREESAREGFPNIAAYVEAILNDERARRARFEALVREGIASSEPYEVAAEFWDRLRAPAKRRLAEESPEGAGCSRSARRPSWT